MLDLYIMSACLFRSIEHGKTKKKHLCVQNQAQLVTSPTSDPGVASWIPARFHTFHGD